MVSDFNNGIVDHEFKNPITNKYDIYTEFAHERRSRL